MGDFFNSAVGSYFKSFLAIFLTLIVTQMASGLNIFSLDWGVLLNGAIASFLPVIINVLNPRDTRYGKKEK